MELRRPLYFQDNLKKIRKSIWKMKEILARLQRIMEGEWDIYAKNNSRDTCHTQVSLELNESALSKRDKGSPYPLRTSPHHLEILEVWSRWGWPGYPACMTSFSPYQFKSVFGPACSVSSTLWPDRQSRSKLGLFIRGKKHCLAGDIRVWSLNWSSRVDLGQ
jgi:hypothetical protein